jgi:hypothetical protein
VLANLESSEQLASTLAPGQVSEEIRELVLKAENRCIGFRKSQKYQGSLFAERYLIFAGTSKYWQPARASLRHVRRSLLRNSESDAAGLARDAPKCERNLFFEREEAPKKLAEALR